MNLAPKKRRLNYLIEIVGILDVRDHLFYVIDKFLPRSVAIYPYMEALRFLYQRLDETGLPVKVWHRNSIFHGNFVFGVSDLDITLFVYSRRLSSSEFSKIKLILKEAKRIYPFLGECNFYFDFIAKELIHSSNFFEIRRDLLLLEELKCTAKFTPVDGVIFVMRMLYADRLKLSKLPYLRQKKWKAHLEDVFQYKSKKIITANTVIELVIETLRLEPTLKIEVTKAIKILNDKNFKEENVFDLKLPLMWRFLFPHRHIWFLENELEGFSKVRGTILADICLRQIDWEVWGLMGQLPFLPEKKYGFRIHLERLHKVVINLDESSKVLSRIEKLLSMEHLFD